MWLQAAEIQTTVGDIWLSRNEHGKATSSFRGAAKTYEVRLDKLLEAAQLRERIGDITRPELAIQDYEKARALYGNAGKEEDQRRVQRKIWDL
jgi:hypothetical protein